MSPLYVRTYMTMITSSRLLFQYKNMWKFLSGVSERNTIPGNWVVNHLDTRSTIKQLGLDRAQFFWPRAIGPTVISKPWIRWLQIEFTDDALDKPVTGYLRPLNRHLMQCARSRPSCFIVDRVSRWFTTQFPGIVFRSDIVFYLM
jgi:hypothetical protein